MYFISWDWFQENRRISMEELQNCTRLRCSQSFKKQTEMYEMKMHEIKSVDVFEYNGKGKLLYVLHFILWFPHGPFSFSKHEIKRFNQWWWNCVHWLMRNILWYRSLIKQLLKFCNWHPCSRRFQLKQTPQCCISLRQVKAHQPLHFIYHRQHSYLRRVQHEAVALLLRILDSEIKDDSPDLPWHCVFCLFQINISFWDWAEFKLICRRYTHAKRSAWFLSRLLNVNTLKVVF